MTQTLLIKNDEKDEFIKFNVQLPTGYNNFSVDSINGTIINQNYLKVGDKLSFDIQNQPITYNNFANTVQIINNRTAKTATTDTNKYPKLVNDIFKFYKLVYIPIYQFYDNQKGFIFLFNPCLDDMLLDEPKITDDLREFKIINKIGKQKPIYMSFCGQFVLGLKYVESEKINITLTIGESISNTKNKAIDEGAFVVNQLGELTAANVNNIEYSYASVWKYNVNNLLMKHHLTITRTRPGNVNNQTIYVLYEYENNKFKNPTYGENITGTIEGGKGENGLQVYDDNKALIPNINILNIDSERISLYNIFKLENGNYNNINGNEDILSISAADLLDPNNNYYWRDGLYWRTYAYYAPFEIFNNTTYDLIEYYICAFLDNESRCDKQIKINTPINAVFDGTRYTVANADDPSDTFDVYFKVYDENIQEFILNPEFKLWLSGILLLNTNASNLGEIYICTNIISGEIKHASKSTEIVEVSSVEAHKAYLQLTQTITEPRKPAIDDLLLYNLKPTPTSENILTLTAPILKNEIHNMDLANNDQITISPMYWMNTLTTHTGDITPKCFIPLRNTRPLNSYYAKTHYNNSGFFYITDLNGDTPDDLTDDKSSVFLATGHETLNIDKIGIDDSTFKTFNGTIMFDRSNSKITRLFSNDLETGLLGYISDILAAKLSRYYFVCDYNSYNMFMNTNTNLTIPTNKRGLLKGYDDQKMIYTQPHIITLSSCEDIIKLVGSENVINNIMPNICPEEHAITTTLIKDSELYNKTAKDLKLNMFYYKLFHYYSSSLDDMPYMGLNVNDDSTGATTIGGISLVSIDKDSFMKKGTSHRVGDLKPTEDMIYIVNKNNAINNKEQGSKDITANNTYYSNKYNIINKYGFNCVLPVSRIYRNANIEHTDLTITTGGIKTLHPVYIQAVNRITLNNLLYMIDDIMINKNGFYDNLFMYFRVYNLVSTPTSTLPTDPNNAFILYRLAQDELTSPAAMGSTAKYYVADSFDTLFILNYHNYNNVNDYYDVNDEIESLYEEELIKSMESLSMLNNIQLFSMKRFNYQNIIESVREKAFITWVQAYAQSVSISNNVAVLYVDELEEKPTGGATEQLNEYITDFLIINENLLNGRNRFNKLKVVNVLLLKLGEILDHPAILYGVCYDYNNSNNIKVLFNNEIYQPTQNYEYDNTDTAYNIDSPVIPKQTYKPIDEKYKTNTYLFGVMYRYHQSAKGYVRADNELSESFVIERSQGVKTFEIVLYDEFGRKIPNTDTSQGFNNNLLLELTTR